MPEDELDELTERARILSDATGRGVEDVLSDLLDDGKLNQSNRADGRDLVSQLKEAAELISTVQNISKEVSSNSVLNGGENKTEIKVDTTLEGDIVDRAIESVQRKADNLKKLFASLVPFFLLLTGGSLEAAGVIDFVGSENDDWNPRYSCEPFWIFDDFSYLENGTIFVDVDFYDLESCGLELEGHFIVGLYRGESEVDSATAFVGFFVDSTSFSLQFRDLESGSYRLETEFHTIECEDGTCEHGAEWDSPHQPTFTIDDEVCESDWWWKNEAIFDHDHDGQGYNNDLRIQVDFQDLNSCGEHMNNGYFEIMVGNESRIIEQNFHNQFSINEHYLNLPEGEYFVSVDYYTYDGSSWNGPEAWVSMEGEGVHDTECEPFVYSLNLNVEQTNEETKVSAESDMDCSGNRVENITAVFFVHVSGANMTDEPLSFVMRNYTIQGADYDVQVMTLRDFEVSNQTDYDFYWVAFWKDDTGSEYDVTYEWIRVKLE